MLPKQADIDKKTVTVKKIQTGYLISLYLKKIYLYLTQNKLPNTEAAIRKDETLAKRFMLLNSLLFNLVTTPEKETTLLAIPAMCTSMITSLYHSCLSSWCN